MISLQDIQKQYNLPSKSDYINKTSGIGDKIADWVKDTEWFNKQKQKYIQEQIKEYLPYIASAAATGLAGYGLSGEGNKMMGGLSGAALGTLAYHLYNQSKENQKTSAPKSFVGKTWPGAVGAGATGYGIYRGKKMKDILDQYGGGSFNQLDDANFLKQKFETFPQSSKNPLGLTKPKLDRASLNLKQTTPIRKPNSSKEILSQVGNAVKRLRAARPLSHLV